MTEVKNKEKKGKAFRGGDKFSIEVDEDYCKGCNLCIYYCPRDALENLKNLTRKGFIHPYKSKIDVSAAGCVN